MQRHSHDDTFNGVPWRIVESGLFDRRAARPPEVIGRATSPAEYPKWNPGLCRVLLYTLRVFQATSFRRKATMTDSIKAISESPSPADECRAQLAALVPAAFAEGKLDVAALKRALGEAAVVEGGERYALTWAGKANAYKVLQTPSTATLRPARDQSVNFDQAQHVFIEGENLEVLKVKQKAYFGKVRRHFENFEEVRFQVVSSLTELVS